MPTILKYHNTKPFRSIKSINKQKKKETIVKLSKNINTTIHSETRIEERIQKKSKVKKDIINCVFQWRVQSEVRYKVYWDFGTYILWEDSVLITVLSKDMKTKNFKDISKEQLKILKNNLWIK